MIGRGPTRRYRPGADGGKLARSRRGFSLAEMIVVLAIVLIILGIVLPASRTLWDQRKLSQAENTIQGLLMTARANALRAGGLETGLLFYVNDRGEQRIVAIEQVDDPDPAWQNVFRVVEARTRGLPPPMRVVPRYVVDEGAADELFFDEDELANNSFEDPPASANQGQRHRNFFTMIYSSEGDLLVRRDVLIQDPDDDQDEHGDMTGLDVGRGPPEDPVTRKYWLQTDADTADDIDPVDDDAIEFLVVDADDITVALNLPSVDGLLVYDDSLFNDFDEEADKRNFLLESAQPFYVNRLTGAVILGPVGEVVAP